MNSRRTRRGRAALVIWWIRRRLHGFARPAGGPRWIGATVLVLATATAAMGQVNAASGPSQVLSVQRPAGGPYFGEAKPPATTELFAPAAVAAMMITRTPVFISGGREVFWSTSISVGRGQIMTARLGANGWTDAEALPFSTGEFFDHNPAPSTDGRLLVFASNRPIPGKKTTTLPGTTVPTSDLWMSERTAAGWSAPVPLGPDINTEADEDVPVLAGDGTLYFGSSRPGGPGPAAIYRSNLAGGRFGKPEMLPAPITTSAGEMFNFVASDQSYVIYFSFQSGDAGGLHVSFRESNGSWGVPHKLGGSVGTLRGYFLSVSPDGSALFFTSPQKGGPPAIYWVDASVVTGLRR